jgi:hypothetical protein
MVPITYNYEIFTIQPRNCPFFFEYAKELEVLFRFI